MLRLGRFWSRDKAAAETSDDISRELDAIVLESLAPIALTLAYFYSILCVLHYLTLPPAFAQVMIPLSLVSMVAAYAIRRLVRDKKVKVEHTYTTSFAILFLVLINSAVHMWITGDIKQSTNFALMFVAVGLFFLTPRYIAVAYALIFTIWLSLSLSLGAAGGDILHFGIMNLQAVVIGYLSYFLRIRVNRRLINMRSEALVRESELAKALETSRLFAAAERENKAKTEFLANMSHELRTPLNAILGFSEIMKEETFGPHAVDKYREYSQDIFTAGDHLLSLVNDILDLSRIELNEQAYNIRPVNITRACENCITIVRQHAERRGIKLTYDVPQNLPVLQTDERRLKQVLTNLLNNAVKFTPPKGKIRLEVSAEPDKICIRVSDTGIGMTAEELANATKPFWQAETGLDRSFEGTGLGLALVTEMLKMMKGELTLQSAPGLGTIATVRLPLVSEATTGSASAAW